MADIVTGDDEIGAGLVDAAQDDVGVRVVCIPMIDCDPVELGPEIGLHAAHQVAGEGAQVAEFLGVLGRHDEAKLVAIVADASLEGFRVGNALRCRIDLAPLAFAGDAVALYVAEMGGGRAGRGLGVDDEPRFHDDATGAWAESCADQLGSNMAAPLLGPAAPAAHERTAGAAAALLGGAQHLACEPLRFLVARSARRAWPQPETILVRPRHAACPIVAGRTKHDLNASLLWLSD